MILFISTTDYSAVHGFWPVERLEEPADGPTGRGDVTRGGCLLLGTVSLLHGLLPGSLMQSLFSCFQINILTGKYKINILYFQMNI